MEIILDPDFFKLVTIKKYQIIKKIKIRKMINKQEFNNMKNFFLIALNTNKKLLHKDFIYTLDKYK
jgi:hypothetical protein